MSDLVHQAEMAKLAELFHREFSDIEFLAALDTTSMRQLRKAVSASLFDRHSKKFRRLAESTKLLPNGLVAIITKRAIGPGLAAQITGFLAPEQAVDLSTRLPIPFLAEICLALDPRRARPMLQLMPEKTVVEVALELQRQREFITMARFVDDVTDAQIQAVAGRLSGEATLQSALFIESDARLNQLIDMLPEQSLVNSMQAAASNGGVLWPEALGMIERLEPKQAARASALLVASGPAALEALSSTIIKQDLWDLACNSLEAMDAGDQEILLSSLAAHAGDDIEQHLPMLLARASEGLRQLIQRLMGS